MNPGCRTAVFFLLCWLLPVAGAVSSELAPLKVAVLDDAPPLAYRDAAGRLAGFSISLMQALCSEMAVSCEFSAVKLEHLVEDLAAGHFDVAAVGLLNTPERRQKILFTKPVYRSTTVLFSRAGLKPGQSGVRVATFKGSAQEHYLREQGWDLIGAQNDDEMVEQLQAGVAQACLVPLMSGLNLQKKANFVRLGLASSIFPVGSLENNAHFAIAPQRPELKVPLDKALENIKRNGVFDRINSRFLPLRID